MKCNFYRIVMRFVVLTALVTIFNTITQGQIITSIAGDGFGAGAPNDGAYFGDGGQATAAEFNGPWGVGVDDSGNVYVGDVYNNAIRKISAATGIITTIAGGAYGYNGDGIAATSAQLEYPQDLALDDSGNVYFADLYNGRIRKVTKATGIISTVAGNGSWGYNGDGILATNAEIDLPYTVAVDDSGNVYIADTYNNRIRKVTKATGNISTIAGNGTVGYAGDNGLATNAELNQPYGVTLDDSANIYIADSKNNVIREVEKKTGIIITVAGNYGAGAGYSGDSGPATAAQLYSPLDLVVDSSNNLYISDQTNSRIRQVTAGIITTLTGTAVRGYNGDGGLADTSEIQYPEGVALDKCGNVYIGDYYNQRIRKVTFSNTISVNPLSASICSGGNDTLKASGGGSYKWSPAAGLSDTTGAVVIASPTVTTTYTVTGSAGCSPSTAQIVVTVSQALTLNIQPASPSVCNGQSITLKVTGGTSYQWVATTDTTDSIAVNPKQDTTYELIVSNGSCTRDTLIPVTVNNAPPLVITPPSPATECNGEGIMLSVPASGSGYIWSPSTGLSATTGSTVIANPTADITYTVTGLDSLGCAVSDTEVINIQLGPSKPIITVSVTGDTLISSAINGNQWFVNGTAIHGATDSIFVIKGLPTNDTITVSVTNVANGCSTTSGLFITGINPLALNSRQLSIYPNPTNGIINVNISPSVTGVKDWSLQLVDVLGRIAYTKSSLNYTNTIDVSALPGGVYFITVISKAGRMVFPVVKQN